MLNVIERAGQNGKTYSNVDSVAPVPAMIKQNGLPAPINPNELFTLQEPDMAIFANFSDHLKAKIQSSPEWEKLKDILPALAQSAKSIAEDDFDSDIPF
jgi:hypothetical protein